MIDNPRWAYVLFYNFESGVGIATGEFVEAQGTDQVVYELPSAATMRVDRPVDSPDQTDNPIAFFVEVDKPIRKILNDYPPEEHEVYQFPPSGAHYIYMDGTTAPDNLPELVINQLQNGWKASEKLLDLLKIGRKATN